MTRPTALIRQLIVLEMLQDQIVRQIRFLKQRMKQSDIVMIERQNRSLDIWIQYSYKQREYEALYMCAMLEAEVLSKSPAMDDVQ